MPATARCGKILIATLFKVALTLPVSGAAAEPPRYRHIDPATTVPAELPQGIVRMLADKDFAPFSFTGADGSQAGLSVDLARAACAELRLACEIVPLPFDALLPALERGDGDVIVTGARLNEGILSRADATRPYYLSVGRFFIHKDTKFADASVRSLAGKKLGYVRGTQYGAFVEKHYARSALTPYAAPALLFAGLRARQVDVAFADGLYSLFWLKSSEAQGCCVTLDRAFVDRATFSRGLAFLARKDRKGLRESLDYALDRLEEQGQTAKVMSRYVPGEVW